jgi:hypothetical protein
LCKRGRNEPGNEGDHHAILRMSHQLQIIDVTSFELAASNAQSKSLLKN